jgi:hypothetical protein
MTVKTITVGIPRVTMVIVKIMTGMAMIIQMTVRTMRLNDFVETVVNRV